MLHLPRLYDTVCRKMAISYFQTKSFSLCLSMSHVLQRTDAVGAFDIYLNLKLEYVFENKLKHYYSQNP